MSDSVQDQADVVAVPEVKTEETTPVVAEPAQTEVKAETTDAAVADAPAVKEEAKDVAMTDAAPEETSVKTEETQPAKLLKTTAKINHEDHRKNRKYDPSVLPETDDPDKIRAQVEFYFSDSNFPTDKFMWETAQGEKNLPVPIKTLHNFKRMQRFKPYSAVVAALRESKFLEVSGEEGEEVVKRKTAYRPSHDGQKERTARSVYVKGFGDETPTSQFDIEAFFATWGPVSHVKLRRTNENLFKGSVFVEFESVELAEKFLALDPKPTWDGHELLIKKKTEYLAEKNQLIKEGKLEPNQNRKNLFFEGKEKTGIRGGRGGGRGGRGGGDFKKRDGDDRKNGFKNNNSRGRGGRGGRGNGRGGRGGNRDNKSRDEQKPEAPKRNTNDAVMPTIQTTDETGKVLKPVTNGKRAREDDGEPAAPAAKKVDTKIEA
ncbi:La protein [Podospora australis]|uniref:La protein n=1 Tax=Podospora australis TaxID=1536484 RepID=A0AAN7APN3_9PEZI|nr:La protein [Podospora australis]